MHASAVEHRGYHYPMRNQTINPNDNHYTYSPESKMMLSIPNGIKTNQGKEVRFNLSPINPLMTPVITPLTPNITPNFTPNNCIYSLLCDYGGSPKDSSLNLNHHTLNHTPLYTAKCNACNQLIMPFELEAHTKCCPALKALSHGAISCYDPGDMKEKHRKVILETLKNCQLQANNYMMNMSNIREKLLNEGMTAMVINGDVSFEYNHQSMTWSKWKCSNINAIFSILCISYKNTTDDDKISCIDDGNISDKYRKIVHKSLKYCSKQKTMSPVDIRNELKHRGLKTIVVKDSNGLWAYSGHNNDNNEKWEWSEWHSSKYGDFTVIIIQYKLPKDSTKTDTIKCIDEGNMEKEHKLLILNELKYLSKLDKMSSIQIADRLSRKKGIKSVVIQDSKTWAYSMCDDTMTWAIFESAKYGLYSVIITDLYYDLSRANTLQCL